MTPCSIIVEVGQSSLKALLKAWTKPGLSNMEDGNACFISNNTCTADGALYFALFKRESLMILLISPFAMKQFHLLQQRKVFSYRD